MDWLSQAKFWILLILSIPSTICSLLILTYFYRRPNQVLIHHHLIIVLLVVSLFEILFDMTAVMAFYRRGYVAPATAGFCTWWTVAEYSANGVILWSLGWGSVERHLLIFHNTLMSTRRKRFIFHFCPMVLVFLYPCLFYFSAVALNSCQNRWDFKTVLCSIPCYLTDYPSQTTYNYAVNIVFPFVVIAVANVTLIIRVVQQKRRHHSSWNRQRKLTVQLVTIAVLCMFFWFPLAVNGVLVAYLSVPLVIEIQVDYFFFLIYMVPLLLPFVSLSHLPDFFSWLFKRQARAVGSTVNTI